MEISKEKIENLLDKYVTKTFGSDFEFRPQQKEAIIDISQAFFDGTCNLYLLDAPTGAGKSIIAMVTAGFLSDFNLNGYILASDLALQTQYENDFKRLNTQWGSVKGVDNYNCVVNNEKFSLGECKIKNISYDKAESTMPCFNDCGYFSNRKKAIKSPVSLLNYSYWLIQRNYVEPKMKEKGHTIPFPKRDFTFCDEAHKVSDIVQNHFSPRIDDRSVDKMEKIRMFLQKNRLGAPSVSALKLRTLVKDMFKEEDVSKLYNLLKTFELYLIDFIKSSSKVKDVVAERYAKIEVPKEWKFNLALLDWLKDMHCKYEDYNHIISQAGLDSLIKNQQGEQIVFNCLDESYMMDRHFHTQGSFKLLMTATMGDPSVFLKTIGATDARYFKMDSTFDYEKSPIYFYPKRKMSMAQKDKTIPWAVKKVDDILSKHKNERGIIHSGSYEITSRIHAGLSEENKKRVLIYQGTQEKEKALERYLYEDNLILMGPSILEGLDLSADKSRLQIFLKVPFPSLGDRFVKAKMVNQPDWYDYRTITSILQGIGRSVRKDGDWAVTYFLDGCLGDLLRRKRSFFPTEMQKRIIVVNEDI